MWLLFCSSKFFRVSEVANVSDIFWVFEVQVYACQYFPIISDIFHNNSDKLNSRHSAIYSPKMTLATLIDIEISAILHQKLTDPSSLQKKLVSFDNVFSLQWCYLNLMIFTYFLLFDLDAIYILHKSLCILYILNFTGCFFECIVLCKSIASFSHWIFSHQYFHCILLM